MGPGKVGRNNPCHCGSGRKYKDCHQDFDKATERRSRLLEQAVLVDQLGGILNEVAPTTPGFETAIQEPAARAREALLREIGDGLSGQKAAEALERFLGVVEDEMKDIASRHSRAYWLQLTRRLAPDPIAESGEWTVGLYRRVLSLAIIKHGLPEPVEDEFQEVEVSYVPGDTMLLPKELDPDDVRDAHALEMLAHEFDAGATAFRRVGKGSALLPTDEGLYFTPADDELEDLMQLTDRRVERYGDLTTGYGAIAETRISDFKPESFPFTLLVPVLNVERHPPDWFEQMRGLTLGESPSFHLALFSVERMREVLSTFEAEIQMITGLTPDVIFGAMWAISTRSFTAAKENPTLDVQLLRTGYRPITAKGEKFDGFIRAHASWFAAWWETVRGEKLEEDFAIESFTAALDALRYRDEDIERISLWWRLPFRMVIPAESQGFFFLDHSAIPQVLSGLFHEVGQLVGEPANVRAANFEEAVARRAREAGIKVWEERRELRASESIKREIDLGLVVGDVLYVVECKAFSRSPRVDIGDYAALKARRETLEKYLDQAATLAELLRQHRSGSNYRVPDGVTRIEHLLCTPGIEYLWPGVPELWLDEPRMPRICVVEEMIGLLSGTETEPVAYPRG